MKKQKGIKIKEIYHLCPACLILSIETEGYELTVSLWSDGDTIILEQTKIKGYWKTTNKFLLSKEV